MVSVQSDTEPTDIRELTLGDIDSLRLGWWSRFDPADVEAVLKAAPGLSTWIPELHEYALVGPWRHREDIAHVIELVSIRHPVPLTVASLQRAKHSGVRLFLAVEMTERRRSSFYEQVGLTVLEEVLSYELPRPGTIRPAAGKIEPVVDPSSQDLDTLLEIDSDAFPWLWRNSFAEFREYLRQPGVETYFLVEAGEPVGYLGITSYSGWGHIDRVAVRASYQGHGLGRKLTVFAISRLTSLGSTRIGLSTQRRNDRSQSLYESLGFRRQAGSDYLIYGCPLVESDSIDTLVTGTQR